MIYTDQDFGLSASVVLWPGTRLTWSAAIECSQRTAADPDDIDALEIWGAAAAAPAVMVGNPILNPALADLAYPLVLIAEELEVGPRTTATLEFAIDTPLVPGANATVCCVKGRDPACVTGGLRVDVPCWCAQPPAGAGGCCDGTATRRLEAAHGGRDA